MHQEIFADQFGDMSLTGSTVRIDLVSLSPTEKGADEQPAMVFRERIVLPVEGFLRSFEMMQRMLNLLVERGVVTREQGGAPVQAAGEPVAPPPALAHSPNFPA